MDPETLLWHSCTQCRACILRLPQPSEDTAGELHVHQEHTGTFVGPVLQARCDLQACWWEQGTVVGCLLQAVIKLFSF